MLEGPFETAAIIDGEPEARNPLRHAIHTLSGNRRGESQRHVGFDGRRQLHIVIRKA
jgi:hypothetical protein